MNLKLSIIPNHYHAWLYQLTQCFQQKLCSKQEVFFIWHRKSPSPCDMKYTYCLGHSEVFSRWVTFFKFYKALIIHVIYSTNHGSLQLLSTEHWFSILRAQQIFRTKHFCLLFVSKAVPNPEIKQYYYIQLFIYIIYKI